MYPTVCLMSSSHQGLPPHNLGWAATVRSCHMRPWVSRHTTAKEPPHEFERPPPHERQGPPSCDYRGAIVARAPRGRTEEQEWVVGNLTNGSGEGAGRRATEESWGDAVCGAWPHGAFGRLLGERDKEGGRKKKKKLTHALHM